MKYLLDYSPSVVFVTSGAVAQTSHYFLAASLAVAGVLLVVYRYVKDADYGK